MENKIKRIRIYIHQEEDCLNQTVIVQGTSWCFTLICILSNNRNIGMELGLLVSVAVPQLVSQNYTENERFLWSFQSWASRGRRKQGPSNSPVNLFLLDIRDAHKKEALQLPQSGYYFNKTIKIWGTPENLVPRGETIGDSLLT